MLNTLTIVGRIKEITKKEEKNTYITVSVPRPYKNEDGEYGSDELYVILKYNLPIKVETGDLIGIKGRLENIHNEMFIIAEKTTFLSRKDK